MDDTSALAEKREKGRAARCRSCVRGNLLVILLLCFMVVGIVVGVCLQMYHKLDERQLFYLKFPGDLLLNMLKMMIIPLITSSLISGTSSVSSSASGKIGGRAVAYYMATTLIAVVLGIVLVVTIKPGQDREKVNEEENDEYVSVADTLLDLVRNAFPSNLVLACFELGYTEQVPQTVPEMRNVTNSTTNVTVPVLLDVIVGHKPKLGVKPGTNILGLVVFSIVFGIIIGGMGENGLLLRQFFQTFSEAVMRLVRVVIWYAPIGICFLVAHKLAESPDLMDLLEKLALYMVTVIAGLAIHGFIILPLIYAVGTFSLPFKFMYGMLKAIITAFGTASSSATLPITLQCLEENNGLDKRVTRTVVPIGATINMDGTALYEAVAAIFIAQMEGVSLSAANIIVISLTSTLASIGAAGIPEAGLVTMAMVLTAVGLPLEAQAVIITVDWFLDRFRTAINVWGDSVGAGLVNKFSAAELEAMDRAENQENDEETVEDKKIHSNGHANSYANGHLNGLANGGFESTTYM